MGFRNRRAQFPPSDGVRAGLVKAANPPGHPAPKAPGETPRSLPPPNSAAARAAVPPAHVGPSARAPPHPLPGPHGRASHIRREPAPEPAPPARTPSAPGSAATSRSRGLQAGRVPPPVPGCPRAQPGRTRRPRRQHGPAAPTTGAALTATPELRFLRPMQAWLCPQSIHAPGRLLGTLTQPPRVALREGGGRLPGQLPRRLVSAPALATSAA